jgi:DNA-binding NtrC family response regulator
VGGSETTVLVVEDDVSLRLLCRVNLELEGYRVLEAATLALARDLLASEPIDVVLLDVHVSRESGLELLYELDAEEERPALALFTGDSRIDAAVHDRVDGVIAKPFTLEDLSGTVARLATRVA